jgi:uncharacterized protein (DUF1778 family)
MTQDPNQDLAIINQKRVMIAEERFYRLLSTMDATVHVRKELSELFEEVKSIALDY